MLSSIDAHFSFMQHALNLRAHRQQMLASNIANADTPDYKAVDIDFGAALRQATGARGGQMKMAATAPGHMLSAGSSAPAQTLYRTVAQGNIDGNTVDMDAERGQFTDNAVHYQAVLRFLNGQINTMMTAIKGQ